MAESFFLDGGSRLDHVENKTLASVSEWRPVALRIPAAPDVGRCRTGYDGNAPQDEEIRQDVDHVDCD
jgi:hypothetical protein